MTLGTGLVVLALVFLIAHLFLDARALVVSVRHPKDILLTIITVVTLTGHLALDWIRG